MDEIETIFLTRNQLGKEYHYQAQRWFQPIFDHLKKLSNLARRPYIIGINGAQGSGKSTLADYLCSVIAPQNNINAITISIDDFYHTKHKRIQIAHDIHPLLSTRGVPGTHDIELAIDTLDKLSTGASKLLVPRFNKSIDDRYPDKDFLVVDQTPDLLILEGWCMGATAQDLSDLKQPINDLERDKDPNLIWRQYVNDCLAGSYQRFFAHVDSWIMLRAPSFMDVFDWRLEQEQKLVDFYLQKNQRLPDGVMTSHQIKCFIQHYQRITEVLLKDLPQRVNWLFQLDKNRSIVSYKSPVSPD